MRAKTIGLVLLCTVALPLWSGSTAVAKSKKKARLPGNKIEVSAKPSPGESAPPRTDLDEAIRLARNDQYAQAAVRLAELVDGGSPYAEEARYHLAKSLYRLDLLHSAVHHFAKILEAGPSSRFYKPSLEWCLFISRKVVNGDAVDDVVARYSNGDFPDEYRDEFLFRLARFHYARSLAIESGAITGALGETRIEETVTGGKSLKGDIFGGSDESSEDADAAPKTSEGGGLSFEDDIFGSGDASGDKNKNKKDGKQDKADKDGKGGKADRDGRGGSSKRGKPQKGRSTRESRAAEKTQEETAKVEPKPEAKGPPSTSATKGASPQETVLSAKDHIEAAERVVMRVNAESKFGPRGKFLEALILYKLGRDNDALEAFKSVVRLTKGSESTQDEKLRELAFFQLARTHFGAKQPSFSIFYYDKIDRDSYAWLDAIYESSWAEFRLGTYEKALGNLLTLHSPFFAEEYYPESLILKAVIYYENCRYPEAKEILKSFLARYEPVFEELKTLTSQEQSPDKYYEILANLRAKEAAEARSSKATIVSQILALALTDANLERLDAAYQEVDRELKRVSSTGVISQSRLAADLDALLGSRRADLGRAAGRAVKRKLDQERDEIKTLIEQAIRIDVETSRAQVERIEAQLQDIRSRPKDTEREFTDWTDDERLVWPFEGEYWRDELGTYQLTLAHSCAPAAPTASGR